VGPTLHRRLVAHPCPTPTEDSLSYDILLPFLFLCRPSSMWNVLFLLSSYFNQNDFSPFCPCLLGLQKQQLSPSSSARRRRSTIPPIHGMSPRHLVLPYHIMSADAALSAPPWMTSSRPSRSPSTPRPSSPPPQSFMWSRLPSALATNPLCRRSFASASPSSPPPHVTSLPLKKMVSPNQDHYMILLSK
jgi:hypothetical protein